MHSFSPFSFAQLHVYAKTFIATNVKRYFDKSKFFSRFDRRKKITGWIWLNIEFQPEISLKNLPFLFLVSNESSSYPAYGILCTTREKNFSYDIFCQT